MGQPVEADITLDSPDSGESMMVKPISEKGDMVFSSNEWSSPHDMSGQDVMHVIGYFTADRDCIVQMLEHGKHVGYVTP